MEYNFSSISVDAITTLEKKLSKIKEEILSDIGTFIYVLNDQAIIEKKGELGAVIGDLMNDFSKKSVLEFTGVMNKVQTVLRQYL